MRAAPGPPGQPFIGSYRDLQRDALGFFVRCSRDYGHVVRFTPFPGQRWHFISHPDDLERVLQHHHGNYPKGLFGRLNALAVGDGIISAEGAAWVRRRRLVLPAFHASRTRAMGPIITSATGAMAAAWTSLPDRPRRVDLPHELMRLALGIAGRTLCGVDFSAGAHDEFGAAFRETLAYLDYRLVHPFALPLAIPTPRNLRYRRAVARLSTIIGGLIEARRAQGGGDGDVLSALLAARDEDGSPIDAAVLREELRTHLAAGHETTISVLFWSLYLIARHPDHERRLHAEVDALGRDPGEDDLARLPFTRMVVAEALRLYPPVVWLGRVAAADDEIRGYAIPAGGGIVFSMFVTQRHPEFWTDPDVFDPDRFTPAAAAARPRNAYLPFGLGPRRCLGERIAGVETALVLAMISRRFRLRPVQGEPVRPVVLAALRPPAGVVMEVEPR